jgi:hypothetical protein
MSKYTPITLAEMRQLLKSENGWIELTGEQLAAICASSTSIKEHYFDYPIKGCTRPLRVATSIMTSNGVTRSVGADAIRVFVPGIRKSVRVFRVEGWRTNLQRAVTEMLADLRANGIPKWAEPKPEAPVAAPAPVYSGILNLFANAQAKGLKKPKVRFDVDGQHLEFKLAGSASKYNGQIIVSDGGPYGASKFFGVISQSGSWTPTKFTPPGIVSVVSEFNANPVGFTSKHGKLTGRCCYCYRHLETAESLHAGYGPVCADKFGLPWGEVDEDHSDAGIAAVEGGA